MALQRGNAVSFHNTMVTEQIAVATIILYVYNNNNKQICIAP